VEEILKSLKKMDKSISINFVGEDKIKSLNRIYRKKDKVTDVLSFLCSGRAKNASQQRFG